MPTDNKLATAQKEEGAGQILMEAWLKSLHSLGLQVRNKGAGCA